MYNFENPTRVELLDTFSDPNYNLTILIRKGQAMKISKQMVQNVTKRLSFPGLSMGLNQSGCWLELQPVAMVERRIDSVKYQQNSGRITL